MNTAPTLDPAVQTLASELDQITFDSGEIFELCGIPFQFFLCDFRTSTLPAWYTRSRSTGGFEIYLQRGIVRDRVWLAFHEVVEASLVYQHWPIDEAHEYALEQERLVFGQRESFRHTKKSPRT